MIAIVISVRIYKGTFDKIEHFTFEREINDCNCDF